MSTDPVQAANQEAKDGQPDGDSAGDAQGQPSEEQLRAAYEAEMSRITSADMVLQAAVSLLNIGSYRLGMSTGGDQPAGEVRDLEQVRDAIDGVRGLLPILERRLPNELRPLRDALSQLQMAYAREAGTNTPVGPAGAQAPPTPKPPTPKQDTPAPASESRGPGPAESSGRLWVPGR